MNAIKRQNQKCQKSEKGCRATALISVANQSDNPLLKVDTSYGRFTQNNLDLSLTCHRWPQLEDECQQWMVRLIADNMKPYYESSSGGWSESNKLKELAHKTSRLLVLRTADTNQLIAFLSFRFEAGGNDAEAVVYCYELQVVDSHQRLGIGRYLMSCLYAIGLTFRMNKVMLTVFKRNSIALDFYTKALKYRTDRSDPSRFQTKADYEILSLKIDRKSNH